MGPRIRAGVAALMLYAAPSSGQQLPEHSVLRIVPNAGLLTLDPIITTAGVVQSHAHLVYDQLFGRDAEQRPQPQMVDLHALSDDALTWRFRLRRGLAFHDGTPVTAEDVVASLRRWGARDPHGRQILETTAGIAAEPDGRSITWTLRRPYPLMLHALSKPAGNMPAIMPARIAATDPFIAIRDTIGSGPFIFQREEWMPGSRTVYRRNPAYVPRAEAASGTAGGKVAGVERIEWHTIGDGQTTVFALLRGELDYIEAPPVDLLPLLRRHGMHLIRSNPLGAPGIIRTNHVHAPFDDVRARQALLLTVDQQEILQGMFPDPSLYRICHAFLVCGSAQETAVGVPPGLGGTEARAQARRLLRESGYDGRPVVIMAATEGELLHVAALVLAQQMRTVGFRTDVQTMEFASMAVRRANRRPPSEGGWDIALTYWDGLSASDPISNLPIQASCERAWPGWPCDAGHQALIDAFPHAATPAERRRLVDALQVSAYRVVPYVPFGQWYVPSAASPRLSGVLTMPGIIVPWNVRKAPR